MTRGRSKNPPQQQKKTQPPARVSTRPKEAPRKVRFADQQEGSPSRAPTRKVSSSSSKNSKGKQPQRPPPPPSFQKKTPPPRPQKQTPPPPPLEEDEEDDDDDKEPRLPFLPPPRPEHEEDEEDNEHEGVERLLDLERRRPNGNRDRYGLRAWKIEYDAALQDRADAARRIDAQQKAKDDAWEAEVAQFGPEEAARRRRLEREARKDADRLLTSDIEEMKLEEQIANPTLKVSVAVRIDKKLTWSKVFGQTDLKSFNIWDFELELYKEIEKQGGSEWNLTQRLVSVRSIHSRARWRRQSVDDFRM